MQENYKILLIDDERINLVVLQGLLQKEGYSIFTALNGREGLELAHQVRPDLILLDVMMPGQDGFKVCEKLKQDPETASIPVIFITALNDKKNRIKGLSVGGLDYISKPFEKEEVFMRVRNILRLNYSFQRIIDEQAARLMQIREAQQAILVHPEELPRGKFNVYFKPFLDAGGDFYDVFEVANNVCDYFIADISGHDLGASFTTSALKALVRYNSSQVLSVEESMTIINRVLQHLLSEDQHITSIYVRLNRNSMKMHVVNAANPPLLFIPAQGEPYWINCNSDALGAFESGEYVSREVDVSLDDRFFMFTDGIIENSGTRFNREQGLEALYRECTRTSGARLQTALPEIVEKLLPRERRAGDDVLFLGVQI